jgi:hypothetical protein
MRLRDNVLESHTGKEPLLLTRKYVEDRARYSGDYRHKAMLDYLLEASNSVAFTRMITVTFRQTVDSIALQSKTVRTILRSVTRDLYGAYSAPPVKYLVCIEGFDYAPKPYAKHTHILMTEPFDQRKIIPKPWQRMDVVLDLKISLGTRRASRGFTDAAGIKHPSLISNVEVRPVYHQEGIIDYLAKELKTHIDCLDIDYFNSNVLERSSVTGDTPDSNHLPASGRKED